jgi:phage terminase large subunit GpA-like protein
MQASDGKISYYSSFAAGLRPDPPLWIDEWADEHMVIPAESGAAEPGRYRVGRTPYARDVMHALSPEHPARKVVVKGSSQLLKTQVALNWISAVIDRAPANIIVLEPTDKLAKRVASRFDKTVQAVPVLREKVAEKKDRDSRNTTDTKEFKGGTAWFLSARSASNLAEASARWLVVDEVDRLLRELKGEGDPVGLAEKRQTTYGRKAKGLYISSPTEEEASRINELYEEGNQQHYYVPCPHCEELQSLEWEQLHYDLAANRAWYVCEHNGCMIEEHHKAIMLPDKKMGGKAEWRSHAEGNGETWSYEISSLYAPPGWVSWLDLAREYVSAQEAQQKGDPEHMQVFYNTRLARCWTIVSSRIKPEQLQTRAAPYSLGIAPLLVHLITAAVDVQGNRLEIQLVGWGPGLSGLEAWIINTHICYGDPTLPQVWNELDTLLLTPIRHISGALMIIDTVCIDSGDGDSTLEVYEFVRRRQRRYMGGKEQRVLAIKGASVAKRPVISRPGKIEYTYRGKPVNGGIEVWQIGTDTAKDWLLNRLALEGQIAIHTSAQLPLDFYQQILSEAKVSRWIKGKKRQSYELIKRGMRNEQLDMLVYNLAAAHHRGVHRYTAERWAQIARDRQQADLLMEMPQETALQPEETLDSSTLLAMPPPKPLTAKSGAISLDGWRRG